VLGELFRAASVSSLPMMEPRRLLGTARGISCARLPLFLSAADTRSPHVLWLKPLADAQGRAFQRASRFARPLRTASRKRKSVFKRHQTFCGSRLATVARRPLSCVLGSGRGGST
jgi:hypothetical protein